MNKQLLIIKLGGSVITDKNKQVPTPRLNVIKNLAKQLKEIYSKDKYQIILVHGTGSFGHPIAKKYKVELDIVTEKQKLGFSLIDQKMLELSNLIVGRLIENNLPALSLPPRAFTTQKQGKLIKLDIKLMKSFLDQGLIPVLFGDMVFDLQLNGSILSSDTLICYLAKKLRPERVIFLSDVDGIFDSDPKKNPKAKLIREINNQNFTEVIKGLTPNNHHDVTGEMNGKILPLRDLKKIDILIANGLSYKSLLKAMDQPQVGTKIYFE